MAGRDDYALTTGAAGAVPAPDLPYLPPRPSRPHRIVLVGAGGISFAHLDAYRSHGFDVAVILSRDETRAQARRDEVAPKAEVMTDYAALLARDDIAVVDLTRHPAERLPLIEAALQAGGGAGGAGRAGDVGACRPALGPPLDRGHALCGDPGYRDV